MFVSILIRIQDFLRSWREDKDSFTSFHTKIYAFKLVVRISTKSEILINKTAKYINDFSYNFLLKKKWVENIYPFYSNL